MKNILKKIIYIFFISCIIFGIFLHIVPYSYNRSLWIDEAYLASSICTRNLINLVSSNLDWGQSAPVGYLYCVKILTIFFGTSEFTLRIFSLITGFFCILIIYLLLKDKVKKHYSLLFTAIFSLTDRYIYYSNELKPYMTDNLCCLLVLYIWQKYKSGKLSISKLILYYSILIWFSFVAVFFIAACMIILCFNLLKKFIKTKNKNYIKKLSLCLIVLASFTLNYALWLSKTPNNVGDKQYWNLLKFPIIPNNKNKILLIIKMIKQFTVFYPKYINIIFISLTLLYLINSIVKKKDVLNIIHPFFLAIFIFLIASSIGLYPIKDRLIQSFPIMFILFSATSCNNIENFCLIKKKIQYNIIYIYFIILLLSCLIIVAFKGSHNLYSNHVYKLHSEVSMNFNFIKTNLKEDEMVYVLEYAIPVWTYKTNYPLTYNELKTASSHPYIKGNTIYGQRLITYLFQKPYSYEYTINNKKIKQDADTISKYNTVYIFTSHELGGTQELIEILKNTGTVTLLNTFYDTPLYIYQKNI